LSSPTGFNKHGTALKRPLHAVKSPNRVSPENVASCYQASCSKKDLFAGMNLVRTIPKSLIPDLKKRLKWFDGDTMYRPGEKVGLTTNERPTAALELIKFLKHADP
jgi:hypothetical protein